MSLNIEYRVHYVTKYRVTGYIMSLNIEYRVHYVTKYRVQGTLCH